ncbi:hypothetical protein DYH09_18650 [bacterium CPR1]|nr:hypothetical protein [bacterium CPR1]
MDTLRGHDLETLVCFLSQPRLYWAEMESGCKLLARSGDVCELFTAEWSLALGAYALGEFAWLEQTGRRLHRQAEQLESELGQGTALGIWALGTGGLVPHELLEKAGRGEQTRHQLTLAQALRLLRDGRCQQAAALLHDCLLHPPDDRMWVPLACFEATAWRQAAESSALEAECQELYRRARRAARRACKASQRFMPFQLAHALREEALLAAARGHVARAESLLARSLQEALTRQLDYEAALTELEWERFRGGDPSGPQRRLLSMGAFWHAAPTPPPTLALADRFEQALHWGRQQAECLDEERWPGLLRDAALALLRGEEALVLSWPELSLLAGPPGRFSRSLLEAAARSGRAQVADESDTESLLLSSVRSALAAPVQVGGATVACLYTTGLFAGDEQDLADFLTALAGGALENVLGLTAGRKSREQLLAEQALVEGVFEASGVGLALLDAGQSLLRANQAFLARSGGSLAEALRPCETVWHELQTGRRDSWVGHIPLGGALSRLSLTALGEEVVASLAEAPLRGLLALARFQRQEAAELTAQVHEHLVVPLQKLESLLEVGELERAGQLAGETVRSVSTQIGALRNPVVEGRPLLPALRSLLRRWQRSSGLSIRARLPRKVPGGPAAEVTFRLVERSLEAVRESGARNLLLVMGTRRPWLQVRIRHDGGVLVSRLRPLRARARLLGGGLRTTEDGFRFRVPLS